MRSLWKAPASGGQPGSLQVSGQLGRSPGHEVGEGEDWPEARRVDLSLYLSLSLGDMAVCDGAGVPTWWGCGNAKGGATDGDAASR